MCKNNNCNPHHVREHSPEPCAPCHKHVVIECDPCHKPKHHDSHHKHHDSHHKPCCKTFCDSRMSCKANVQCYLENAGSSKEMYIRRYHLENVKQQCPGRC